MKNPGIGKALSCAGVRVENEKSRSGTEAYNCDQVTNTNAGFKLYTLSAWLKFKIVVPLGYIHLP